MGTTANYYNLVSGGHDSFLFVAGSFLRLAIRSWLPPSQNKIFLVIFFMMLLFLIIILFIKIQNKNIRNALVTSILLWLISLLPYITLSIDTKGVESERFLYLPSLFVCLIISVFFVQFAFAIRISFVFIICLINLVVLAHHAVQYRFAGSIVSSTVNAVNNLKDKKILYADNVPEENFGALILRNGFDEGISWLKNNGTVDTTVVLSQMQHDLPLQKNYRVTFSNNLALINDSIKKSFTDDDVYFLYTDSLLYVINKK